MPTPQHLDIRPPSEVSVQQSSPMKHTNTTQIRRVLMSDTDTTPRLMIKLNYVIFSNYYRCRPVSVCVMSGVGVYAL
jgi:hypothetical protein